MNPTKLIAIYARVSTSNQENEGTIENQLSEVKRYAEANGYTIVREYIDNGWSGDTLIRPALDELRQDTKSKQWEAVLIYDPDRLARRYSYQELVMDELKEAGIEVMFVTITSPKNSEDKILHGVRGLFAEYERAKIAERFRLGKLRKVKNGNLLVSEALYGYKYVARKDDVHGHYEIDENESNIIKQIFDWIALDKMTLNGVVRKLQDLNIKPRKSKRGVWNTSTLRSQIINKAYIGEARWGSSYAVVPDNPLKNEKYKKVKKSSRKIRPEEDWVIIPVPPIIDKRIFEMANNQLKENFKLCDRNRKNDYLLGHKIYCNCGARRNGEGIQKGKHLYYRCSDRVKKFPIKSECVEKGLNARLVDVAVWNKLAELMSSPELVQRQLTRWIERKQNSSTTAEVDFSGIEKQITNLRLQEERYHKAYGAGVYTVEKLKELIAPIQQQISSLGQQLIKTKEETREVSMLIPTKEEILQFSQDAIEKLRDLKFEQKREIVLSIVEKVVGTQEQLTITGYLPITSSFYVSSKSISRHRRTPKRGKINPLQRHHKKISPSRKLPILYY